MLKNVDLEIGKTYFHAGGTKTFKVLIEYGNRYVLLPKLIETGEEMAPVVVGDNDLPFFKNLVGTGSEEELKKRLQEINLASLKEQWQAKKDNLSNIAGQYSRTKEEVEEIKTKIDNLKMIMYAESES